MIEKEFFGYVISCDKCSNYYNCECSDNFLEAISLAKKEGWRIRKDKNDDWEHICPVCYQEEGEKLATMKKEFLSGRENE